MIVTTLWCGACGAESAPRPDGALPASCTGCRLPLDGAEADHLRATSQDYRTAVARGDHWMAERMRREHAETRARLEARAAGRPPLPPTDVVAVDEARISASTLVTWAGAALLLAGGLAFATVVWQYAGGPGRIAILVLVTVAALLGADRLRRTAPTTAEAATAIAAGMVVVDAIAAHVAGYVALDPPGWAAVSLLPSGAAFLLLARRWSSRLAGICGATLVGLGTLGLALWPMTWSAGLPATATGALAAAIACAALGFAARGVRRDTERAAVVTAAAVLWVVQGGVAATTAVLQLTVGRTESTGWVLVLCLGIVGFAALPLTVPVRDVATALLAGIAASAPLVGGVALATSATYLLDVPATRAGLVRSAVLALLVVVPTLTARLATRPASPAPDRQRAAALAALAAPAYVALTLLTTTSTLRTQGTLDGARDLALLSLLLMVPVLVLAGRVPARVSDALASTALVGLMGSAGLAVPVWLDVPAGDVLAVLAAISMVSSVALRRGTWATATTVAACVSLTAAAVCGVTAVEWWSVPAAVVAAGAGVAVHRRGRTSSWVVEAPAAALLLVPTLVVALAGERTGLRLGVAAVAATLVLLDAARRHRQGPAVVAACALSVTVGWVLVPHVSEVPSWAALAGSGALLLWVGFTWESRRATARHLAQSWSTWE